MQQRYYDPVIGRFYSNDPVGFTASNPMMFNRYAYANNNPYKYTDPDGETPAIALGRAAQIGYSAGTRLNSAITAGLGKPLGVALYDAVHNESAEDVAKGKIKDLVGDNPTGEDLQNPPGEGWEWKGNPSAPVGSAQGAWVNPETGEQIHNDLDTHKEGTKRGPHITYTDEDGNRWDYFPKEDKIEQQ